MEIEKNYGSMVLYSVPSFCLITGRLYVPSSGFYPSVARALAHLVCSGVLQIRFIAITQELAGGTKGV
jgi:hypothetical protein